MKRSIFRLISAIPASAIVLVIVTTSALASSAYISQFNKIDKIANTVPANGDQNPYGVAVIQATTGNLVQGNILVSNFNNAANLQGLGTTIDEISPKGKVSLFATIDAASLPGACPGGVGLTTALVVLNQGWVIVGSLPTTDGTSATASAGCRSVLNNVGNVVETISGRPINGPWDMTAVQSGDVADLFVTNVLNGTVAASPNVVNKGTVVRIVLSVSDDSMPQVLSTTVIGSGFAERTDPGALVIGPTGVGLSALGTLYVADTLNNRLAAIPNALSRMSTDVTGKTVSTGGAINGPLGLAVAPNGDILLTNGGDGNLVEVTPGGSQNAVMNIDVTNTGAGTLFGLAVVPGGNGVYFVNDGNNTFNILH